MVWIIVYLVSAILCVFMIRGLIAIDIRTNGVYAKDISDFKIVDYIILSIFIILSPLAVIVFTTMYISDRIKEGPRPLMCISYKKHKKYYRRKGLWNKEIMVID